MKAEVKSAIGEHVETLQQQAYNAADALASGDTTKLEKALSIIEKVARILIVVIGAVNGARGAAKGK